MVCCADDGCYQAGIARQGQNRHPSASRLVDRRNSHAWNALSVAIKLLAINGAMLFKIFAFPSIFAWMVLQCVLLISHLAPMCRQTEEATLNTVMLIQSRLEAELTWWSTLFVFLHFPLFGYYAFLKSWCFHSPADLNRLRPSLKYANDASNYVDIILMPSTALCYFPKSFDTLRAYLREAQQVIGEFFSKLRSPDTPMLTKVTSFAAGPGVILMAMTLSALGVGSDTGKAIVRDRIHTQALHVGEELSQLMSLVKDLRTTALGCSEHGMSITQSPDPSITMSPPSNVASILSRLKAVEDAHAALNTRYDRWARFGLLERFIAICISVGRTLGLVIVLVIFMTDGSYAKVSKWNRLRLSVLNVVLSLSTLSWYLLVHDESKVTKPAWIDWLG